MRVNDPTSAAEAFGREIEFRIYRLGYTKTEFARKAKVNATQLSKILRGDNTPRKNVLQRLADALDTTAEELQSVIEKLQKSFAEAANQRLIESISSKATTKKDTTGGTLIELHRTIRKNAKNALDRINDDPIRRELAVTLASYKAHEEALAGFGRPIPPPFAPRTDFEIHELEAMRLAMELREELDIGSIPMQGALPFLESIGIRIVQSRKLPSDVAIKSFYDTDGGNYVFCLNANAPSEVQLYTLACEMAYAYLFAKNEHHTIVYTNAVGVFARAFGGIFQMPESAIQDLIARLSIGPDDWSLKLICELKWRFGVTARTLLYRLRASGVISGKCFSALQAELGAFESAHPEADEPYRMPPLRFGSWLKTLEARIG